MSITCAGSAFGWDVSLRDKLDIVFGENAKDPTVAVGKFKDMEGNWAAYPVGQLVTLGSIGGYQDGTFKPNGTITRAEFSKILANSLGLSSSGGNVFSDTVNHWAKGDINALVEKGIIKKEDYGNEFIPDWKITRMEIARMLVKAAELRGKTGQYYGKDSGFADDADIMEWDKGYARVAKDIGFIGGYEDGTFRPNAYATRAEASAMIVRALEYIHGNIFTEDEKEELITQEVNKQLKERGGVNRYLPVGIKSVAKYDDPKTQAELIENIESMPVSSITDKSPQFLEMDQIVSNNGDYYSNSFIGVHKVDNFKFDYSVSKIEYKGVEYLIFKSKDLEEYDLCAGCLIKDGKITANLGYIGHDSFSFSTNVIDRLYDADYVMFLRDYDYYNNISKSALKARNKNSYDVVGVIFENPFKK